MPSDDTEYVRLYRTGDVVQVDLVEPLLTGACCVPPIRSRIQRALKQVPKARMVINFEAVEHIGSALLGELVGILKSLTASGGQVRLACVRPALRDVLIITGTNRLFPIDDDVAAAIKALSE